MLNPRNVFKPIYIGSPTGHSNHRTFLISLGSPTGHSNHCTFLISLGSITEELPLQMTRHSSILSIVGSRFTLERGEEMLLKGFYQGLNLVLALLELEPRAPWSQGLVSTTRHLDNHATKIGKLDYS